MPSTENIFETFLAARRAKHGDLRMEAEPVAETVVEPVVESTPVVEPVVEPPVEPATEQTPEELAAAEEATKVADLPDWAQSLVKNLRGENANYRTRATSAETKLADAKTPEDIEAAVAAISAEKAQLERTLLVTQVAATYELPTELAELLKGDDKAALEAHAKSLQKYAGTSEPGSLSGGLDPSSSTEVFDPIAEANKHRRSRF